MRYKFLTVVVLLLSISGLSAATNFTQCLEKVRNGTFGTGKIGATDNHGNILEDVKQATGMTYGLCVTACGSGPSPFRWATFSQRFSSWLLPWLALVSQLPFGPKDRLDNLESVLLTIGSPMLAAYSLALTVLNGRWIARRFSKHKYPNIRNAVRILSSLQQAPLRVTNEGALLASLIVLPHNDEWWRELMEWLAHPHTWSISAATSIAWVVVAYLFTVIGFLMEDVTRFTAHGQESLWLWLLPIAIGWLQLSPKCDEVRVRSAIERANKIAYAATDTHPALVQEHMEQRAIYLAFSEGDEDDVLRRDERVTAPIYNYARFLPWVQAVERVSGTFEVVSGRCRRHESVDPCITWVTTADIRGSGHLSKPHERNRVGSTSQVARYCLEPAGGIATRSRWGPEIFSRIAIASALAFLLQGGTLGAAFLSAYLTPTTGLGCRATSYLLYGALSIIVWLMLLASSFLTHYISTAQYHLNNPRRRFKVARRLAIALRRLAKILATFNAIWIVIICVFSSANFFNRCYCNSSIFSRGNSGFTAIRPTPEDLPPMRNAWIGGVCLGSATAALFVGFVYVFINPPLPDSEERG